MPILTLPATPGFRAIRWGLRAHSQTFESPLSRSVQVVELTGHQWAGTFEMPPMARAAAAAWQAFLLRCAGMTGRFYAGDPAATAPRGVATGTPLVDGASQTGRTLATKGWTPAITGILKAGDYFAYDTPSALRQLHVVTVDADSDVTGDATLSIEPPIRESPADAAALILASPTCVMRLTDDEQAFWDVEPAVVYGLRFSAVEAFKL